MDKKEFINNWLDDNWPAFVGGAFCDHRGKLVTVADALELTAMEAGQINDAFMRGACATHEAIEIIAKAFLLDTVVDELWKNHLAGEAEFGGELSWIRTSKQL